MLMLNGTVVTAFDEAITILCIFLLERSSLHRIFLILNVSKWPEIHTRSLQQKQREMDGA